MLERTCKCVQSKLIWDALKVWTKAGCFWVFCEINVQWSDSSMSQNVILYDWFSSKCQDISLNRDGRTSEDACISSISTQLEHKQSSKDNRNITGLHSRSSRECKAANKSKKPQNGLPLINFLQKPRKKLLKLLIFR